MSHSTMPGAGNLDPGATPESDLPAADGPAPAFNPADEHPAAEEGTQSATDVAMAQAAPPDSTDPDVVPSPAPVDPSSND